MQAAAVVLLPLSFAVAAVAGRPVVDSAWIDEQVAAANRLFAAASVRFERAAVRPLDERHALLMTRADRNALGPEVERGAINVFLVGRLRDVDDPSLDRMGVHWRGGSGRRYVIVAQSAAHSVLAHELGHFFGNGHSTVANNLMSYIRTGEPFLDARQIARIRAEARRLVARGELRPARSAP